MNKKIDASLLALLFFISSQSFAETEYKFVEGFDKDVVRQEVIEKDTADNEAVYLFNESKNYEDWLTNSGQLVYMDVSPNYTGPENSVVPSFDFTYVDFDESVPSALTSYVAERTSKDRRLVSIVSKPNSVNVFEAILSKSLNKDADKLVEALNTDNNFIEVLASVDSLNSHYSISAGELSSLIPENSSYQDQLVTQDAGHLASVFDFEAYQCSSATRLLGSKLYQNTIIGLSQIKKASEEDLLNAESYFGVKPLGMYIQEFMQFSSIIEGMSLTYLIFEKDSKAKLVIMLNSALPSSYTGVGRTGMLLNGFNSSNTGAIIEGFNGITSGIGEFTDGVFSYFGGSDEEDEEAELDDEMSLFEDLDEGVDDALDEVSEQNTCDKGLPGGFHNQSKNFLELTAEAFEAL